MKKGFSIAVDPHPFIEGFSDDVRQPGKSYRRHNDMAAITQKDRRLKKEFAWRTWQLRCYVAFFGEKDVIRCMSPSCSKTHPIHVDHVFTRNWLHGDPWNQHGQVLCKWCNIAKGSEKGPQWDFRGKEYKKFQDWLWNREWERDIKNHWVRRRTSNPPTVTSLKGLFCGKQTRTRKRRADVQSRGSNRQDSERPQE